MKSLIFIFVLIIFVFTIGFFVVRSKVNEPTKESKKAPPISITVKTKPVLIPTLSLTNIFEKEPDLNRLDQNKIVKLIATGDIIPARGVNWAVVAKKDFNYPYEKTSDYLKSADITLANLEAPLFAGCTLQSTGLTFCGVAEHADGLVFAGIDIVNLANNHIDNYGFEGRTKTEHLLEQKGIEWTGFGKLAIVEAKGKKFGFLGYNAVGVRVDRKSMQEEISDAKKKVDQLIISIHWGKEYEAVPMADPGIAPDNPVEIGHLMIDSGADVIIGNHPHWVQGVELYKNKFISYAMGNFVFDQTWSQETQEGALGEYIFYDGKLIAVKYKPIIVDKSYQPRFASESEAVHILKRMIDSSNFLAGK
jgi:poly-gamma-glutamate synthesis protein (capsule biosynthesis protein)